MGEDSTLPFFENEIKDMMQGIIKVIGVGGGGCNAVGNQKDVSDLRKEMTTIWSLS